MSSHITKLSNYYAHLSVRYNQEKSVLNWVRDKVKFPDVYASNLRNCVNTVEWKLVGMKSHDCHVFMQRLLPFAFVNFLQNDIHNAIGGTHLICLYLIINIIIK